MNKTHQPEVQKTGKSEVKTYKQQYRTMFWSVLTDVVHYYWAASSSFNSGQGTGFISIMKSYFLGGGL